MALICLDSWKLRQAGDKSRRHVHDTEEAAACIFQWRSGDDNMPGEVEPGARGFHQGDSDTLWFSGGREDK